MRTPNAVSTCIFVAISAMSYSDAQADALFDDMSGYGARNWPVGTSAKPRPLLIRSSDRATVGGMGVASLSEDFPGAATAWTMPLHQASWRFDDRSISRHAVNWRDGGWRKDRFFTAAYAWRSVTVEGSARMESSQSSSAAAQSERLQLASRIARISYRPWPGLSLQLSRGTQSGLDQLMHNGAVRRSTMSATFGRYFTGGEWQTMVGWGRNARQGRAAIFGYFAETAVRFSGTHLAFAQLEQVGVDDVRFGRPAPRPLNAKIRKVTLGYYHDLHRRGSHRLGFGATASHHLLSGSDAAVFGTLPISYRVFVRLQM